MKKKFLSIMLIVVMLIGVVAGIPMKANAASAMAASEELISLLKAFEGFIKYPVWDYSQYSMGYGSYCSPDEYEYYKTHGITEEEADSRLRSRVSNFSNAVNSFINTYGLTMSQQQFDALVCFSYNCGSRWTTDTKGNLHNAIKNGATGNDLLFALCIWSNASGVPHTGLIERRLREANLYLNGVYSKTEMPSNYSYVLFDPMGGKVDYRVQGYDTNIDTDIRVKMESTSVVAGVTYYFDGWYTASVGGEKVTVLDGSLAFGSKLYAHWKDARGNTVVHPSTVLGASVEVTVTTNNVNLRSGPGTNYSIIGKANQGDKFTITETEDGGVYLWGKYDGGWICLDYTNFEEVRPVGIPAVVRKDVLLGINQSADASSDIVGIYSGGEAISILEQVVVDTVIWGKTNLGWVRMEHVLLGNGEGNEQEKPVARWGTVTGNNVRVRSGPGTSHAIVGSKNNGDRLEILEEKSDGTRLWGKTTEGWICMDYVELDPVTPEKNYATEGRWAEVDGKWFFICTDGTAYAGWIAYKNNWYYTAADGVMQTGWVRVDGNWYYLNVGGIMCTGWVSWNGRWYFCNASGIMQTGWIQLGKDWYYLEPGGKLLTGWFLEAGKWYYSEAGGRMQTGWICHNDKWYYLADNGVMKTGWVDYKGGKYYTDEGGVMQTGWIYLSGKWYYLNVGGIMQTGWVLYNDNWYYLNSKGVMQTGWIKDGGRWYHLNAAGVLIS